MHRILSRVSDTPKLDNGFRYTEVCDMVSDTPNKQRLLPERHPQREMFICDVADAVLKDDMASMEHPFFSLSKKPDTAIRRYENGDKWLEVVPSVKGLATIYDKDVLIYCISQMIHKANNEGPLSRQVRINAHELLVFTNRSAGGKNYEQLRDALDRLDGTRVRTNVQTADKRIDEGFGLIESYKIVRSENSGRIVEMTVTLSEWVFNAIEANEVLTIDPLYFRMRKAIERRVYEIARKHCGKQKSWSIAIPHLQKKCGSRAPAKGFRHDIKNLVSHDHLPQYAMSYDAERDIVTFHNREIMVAITHYSALRLNAETYHDAKTVAPGWDVYALEAEWKTWMADHELEVPQNPDRAFIGFCRKYHEQHRNGR